MGAGLSHFHGNRLHKHFLPSVPNASPNSTSPTPHNSLRQFLFLKVGNLAFQDTWPPKRPRCRRLTGVSASPNICQDALRLRPAAWPGRGLPTAPALRELGTYIGL